MRRDSTIGKSILAGLISAGTIAILYGIVGGLLEKDLAAMIVMPLLIFGSLILPLIGAGLFYKVFISKWTQNKPLYSRLLITVASLLVAVLIWTFIETLLSGIEYSKGFITSFFETFTREFLGWIPALILAAVIMDYLFNQWDFIKNERKGFFKLNNFLN
jgi:signal transduction histidine kinase